MKQVKLESFKSVSENLWESSDASSKILCYSEITFKISLTRKIRNSSFTTHKAESSIAEHLLGYLARAFSKMYRDGEGLLLAWHVSSYESLAYLNHSTLREGDSINNLLTMAMSQEMRGIRSEWRILYTALIALHTLFVQLTLLTLLLILVLLESPLSSPTRATSFTRPQEQEQSGVLLRVLLVRHQCMLSIPRPLSKHKTRNHKKTVIFSSIPFRSLLSSSCPSEIPLAGDNHA